MRHDDENFDQASYLYGFDNGVRSVGIQLRWFWLLVGIFIGLMWRHW